MKQKMTLIDRISSIKAAFTGQPTQSLLSMAARFTPVLGEPPKRSTADWFDLYNKSPRMNPVHQIASDVATSMYGIYKKGDTKKIKLKDNPIEVLLKNPCQNQTITEYALFYLTQVYLLLPSGEAFWLKEKNGLGRITELWPIPPHWVSEIPSMAKPFYTVQPSGNMQAQPIYVLKEDMIYFKKPDIVNPYLRGIGRSTGISDEIEVDEYMSKYQKRFFWNDAIPSMVIQMPGADETVINRTEESWNQKFGGFNNKHKTAFVNWELKAQILKESNKDMDFIASRKYLRDEANQHFCIPPELFGILENSNRSCYSEDTECLTKNGWKLYHELSYDDDIATWDEDKNAIVYSKPSKIVQYDYEGEMHHWKNKNVDVLVTPDHRMYTKTQFKGHFEIKRSYEIADKKLQNVWRATGGNYEGNQNIVTISKKAYLGYGLKGEQPIDDQYSLNVFDFAEFLGFYIAEGSLDKVLNADGSVSKSFAIKIPQNLGEIEQAIKQSLVRLNIGNVTSTQSGPNKWRDKTLATHTLCNKSLWYWLSEHVGDGAYNKKIPRCVFDWPVEAQMIMFDAMMKGDGSKRQERTKTTVKYADQFYSTASYQLASDVQQLCVQMGLRSSIKVSTKGKFSWFVLSISSKQVYYVNTSKIGGTGNAKVSPITKEQYNGIVWCLEVPSHVFFTRRNGKVGCHGNTIDAAYYLYTKNVLRKELKFIDDTINRQLVPEFADNIYFEHDNVVPEDEEFVLKKSSEGLKSGGLLVDEWRMANGYEPLPQGKGKILYTPLNMIPTPLDGNAIAVNMEPEQRPALEPEKSVKKKLTPEMKNQMWHVFDKAAIKYERSFINALKKYFQSQQDKINKSLEKSVKTAIDEIGELLDWTEEDDILHVALKPLWLASMREGFEVANATYSLGVSFDLLNPKFLDWIKEFGAEKVTEINDTTKGKLSKTLTEGITEGEGIPKLRDRVSSVMTEAKTSRAELIARTETASTVNFGNIETMVSGGVKKHTWLTAIDGRERPSHAAINGETVNIGEPFRNGLLYPGDPNGDASEVCNCRCTTYAEIPE